MSFDFDTPIPRLGTGSKKWSRYPADVLPLWVADADFGVAPPILDAIRARAAHPVFGYAAPGESLCAAIQAHCAAEYGWRIATEDLVFLPGVEPGFNMALSVFCQPGDAVVVQTPAYAPILAAPGFWGLRRIDAPLPADGGPIDVDAFRDAVSGARVFLLCHPHNPLGRVFTRGELATMAAICAEAGCLILSDEIHCDLLLDGRQHVPIASLGVAPAITLMSASKAWNIAGLKTAFAIIPDATLLARFNTARRGMVDSVNLMGLAATEAAYAQGGPWRAALLRYLAANRDHLAAVLRDRFPGITMRPPEATFLAWLDCRGLGLGDDPQAFFLERGRVAFSSGTEFGPGGAGHMRVNFGCPRAVLDEALDRMVSALATR